MKPVKLVCFFFLILIAIPSMAAWGAAQQPFDQVAGHIQDQYQKSVAEKNTTAGEIQRRRAALHRKIQYLKASLAAATEGLAADQVLLQELAQKRDAIKNEISTQLARKEELDALFLEHARSFLARTEKSPYSAETPERLEQLQGYMARDRVVGMKDFADLLDMYFDDMAASAGLAAYKGNLVDRGGATVSGEIIRLGHIGAVYRTGDETGYLSLSPASKRLVTSAAPPYLVKRNLTAFFEGKTRDLYFDISGGVAVAQLARQVSLADQLRSGGVLVIPILLVGLVAGLLTLERLFFLGKVRHNTDALMTRVTKLVAKGDFDAAVNATENHQKRPTGRVLMAGLKHRGQPRDVVESALSEAILKETPRLERFLGALKVSAAVAPLLGLLGTVTGMINTFQVITTHGTGDPRLMAGGISEAMVTTQAGLAVAIPIMIIAAFLKRRAHTLSQDMEEKGLALMGALLSLNNNGGRDGRI